MSCSSCVSTLENYLKNIPGIFPDSVQVNLLPQKVKLLHDDVTISANQISQKINGIGYEVLEYESIPLVAHHKEKSSMKIFFFKILNADNDFDASYYACIHFYLYILNYYFSSSLKTSSIL